MLSFMPAWLKIGVNLFLLIVCTAMVSFAICIVACVRILFFGNCHKFFIKAANRCMRWWLYRIRGIMGITNRTEWVRNIAIHPEFQDSYILISNHISWLDTLVLAAVLADLRPVPKFFLKHSLLFVPFVGLACWGLDMPFLRRYSRAYLLKHPDKRFTDIETSREACKKFSGVPTMMVIFPEGTRFTPEKRALSNSPYKNLMQTKPTTIAIAIESLGNQFNKILDVTLNYPDNPDTPFRSFLEGRLKKICISINEIKITDDLRGSYLTDKQFKRHFTLWLKNLWQEKDEKISEMKKNEKAVCSSTNPDNIIKNKD
ncbi:acetyltransferase [Succinimonas amylolytica]|uniref:acetyltransferase n=1 Tax=Succinimonas amylolytica TaxID=83769 RepID=UPI00039C28EA|nr:acetyltransferase [Succinimonas amylolytica]